MVDDGRRAEGLATEVIAPMILGGTVRPQRPFGPHLAFTIGVGGQAHEGRAIVDNETRARVDSARLRVARSVVAVDVVPPLTPIDWAIACGLNDLMQVTNHELSSFATRGRHADLLDATVALCRKVPLCHDLAEAVGR
ncbi:MAG: hypothetical protein KC731_40155, partial [Myxococcales bacterium]|nr:hypothetical protein [Myxococcales bacterium]